MTAQELQDMREKLLQLAEELMQPCEGGSWPAKMAHDARTNVGQRILEIIKAEPVKNPQTWSLK